MVDWKEEFLRLLFSEDRNKLLMEKAFHLKYENLPKSVYKYMRFDEKGHSVEHFKNNTVWLSNPSEFNDPFDSVINIDFSIIYRDLKISRLTEMAETRLNLPKEKIEEIKNSDNPDHIFNEQLLKKAGLTGELLKERLKSLDDYKNSMDSEPRWNIVHDLRSIIRVGSFSEKFNQILMWSHYAEYHKGFCVEYDVSTISENDINLRFLYPVKYSDDLTDFTNQFKLTENMEKVSGLWATKAAMHKAKNWDYESEWRLIIPNGIEKEKSHKFLPIKAVYIGAKIDEKNRNDILTLAKSKNIEVFRLYISNNGFGLESEKIL